MSFATKQPNYSTTMTKINRLFNRIMEAKMPAPKVYFPSMTTEEVLSYASQYAETELEKVLVHHLRESYTDEDVEEFKASVIDVANSIDDVSTARSSQDLYNAVDKLEQSKG